MYTILIIVYGYNLRALLVMPDIGLKCFRVDMAICGTWHHKTAT